MPLTLNQAIRKIVGPYNSTAQASRDLFKTIKDIEGLPKDLQPLLLKFIADSYDLSYIGGGELTLYPKLNGGYQPGKTIVRKTSSAITITEITGAGVNLSTNGAWWVGNIIVPPTATLTVGGVTMAAPGITIVLPVEIKDQTTFSSGVASSWFIGGPVSDAVVTVVAR